MCTGDAHYLQAGCFPSFFQAFYFWRLLSSRHRLPQWNDFGRGLPYVHSAEKEKKQLWNNRVCSQIPKTSKHVRKVSLELSRRYSSILHFSRLVEWHSLVPAKWWLGGEGGGGARGVANALRWATFNFHPNSFSTQWPKLDKGSGWRGRERRGEWGGTSSLDDTD